MRKPPVSGQKLATAAVERALGTITGWVCAPPTGCTGEKGDMTLVNLKKGRPSICFPNASRRAVDT